jgi:hypothetical protein
MNRVIAGGPGLIAVGAASNGNDLDAAVWTSTDGTSWQQVPDRSGVFGGAHEQYMNSVVEAEGLFVGVGWDGSAGQGLDAAVWTSTDGVAWTQAKTQGTLFGGPGDQVILKAAGVGSAIVAVGYDTETTDAAVWLSDGTTWTRVSDQGALGGTGTQRMRAVTTGGPGLVAVGFENKNGEIDAAVWTSEDGSTWLRQHGSDLTGPGGQNMSSVTQGGPGLVAGGTTEGSNDTDAAIWTSSDGVSWTKVSKRSVFGGQDTQEIRLVVPVDGALVAVGMDESRGTPDAAVWTSSDGNTWTRTQNAAFRGPGVQTMWGLAMLGRTVVAVGWSGPNGSFDAAVWTAKLP